MFHHCTPGAEIVMNRNFACAACQISVNGARDSAGKWWCGGGEGTVSVK